MTNNDLLSNLSSKISKTTSRLKPGFKDILGIFKLTWELFKNNKAIQKNFKLMLSYNLLMRFLVFVLGSSFILLGLGISLKWMSSIIGRLLIAVVIMGVYGYFFFSYKRALISCESENEILVQKNNCHELISNLKKDIRLIGIIDMANSLLLKGNASNNKSTSIKDFVLSIFIGVLGEVADLASNFLLPAIVVGKKNLRKAIDDLKEVKNNIPATLVGVLGIDFIGSGISRILIPVYMLIMLLFGIISYGLGVLIKNGPLVVTISQSISLYIPAILIGIGVLAVLDGILKTIVIFTKSIYFTLFYIALKKPSEIKDEYKGNLINYLVMPFEKGE